jgi:hypothetical protein
MTCDDPSIKSLVSCGEQRKATESSAQRERRSTHDARRRSVSAIWFLLLLSSLSFPTPAYYYYCDYWYDAVVVRALLMFPFAPTPAWYYYYCRCRCRCYYYCRCCPCYAYSCVTRAQFQRFLPFHCISTHFAVFIVRFPLCLVTLRYVYAALRYATLCKTTHFHSVCVRARRCKDAKDDGCSVRT